MILTRPAIKITQSGLTIYATSLRVKDLLIPNFYQIDKLDATDNANNSGFQRVLDKTRTKRLADYLLDAWKDQDAFLPTSIFLATDKDFMFDNQTNQITFEVEKICPFNVVDGQHRVAGLIEAARQNPEIENFEIIANIGVLLDDISQMCHFLIVNTTQKVVDKSIEQQIIARLSKMVDLEDIPTLPKWIQRQVLKGEDREALVMANYLNTEPTSPWYGKIRMANQLKNDDITINQNSFVASIKEYILSANNPLAALPDYEKRNKILNNYWQAIKGLLVDDNSGKETVIFKTNGTELFHKISPTVFTILFSEGNFTVQKIKDLLNNAFANLPNHLLEIQSPEWWQSGGGASGLNKGATQQIATELNKALNVKPNTTDLKL